MIKSNVRHFSKLFTIRAIVGLSLAFFFFICSCQIKNKPEDQSIEAIGQTMPQSKMEFEHAQIANPISGKVPESALWKVLQELRNSNRISNTKLNRVGIGQNWEPVNDFFATLSISRLVYDPLNLGTYYFSTGEPWYNTDAVRGGGIFKSTDKGNNWEQLESTKISAFNYTADMLVHPATGHIYVATRGAGLLRSVNAGLSWDTVLVSGFGANFISDVEITENGGLFCGVYYGGVYYSTSGDSGTWVAKNLGLPSIDSIGRVELATAPSDDNIAYVTFDNWNTRKIPGVFKTTDKGESWFSIPDPGGDLNLAKKQAWYDLILKVSNHDANVLIAGGLHLWRSLDGGNNWQQLSHGKRDSTGYQYVHVDQHEVFFKGKDTVYFGNDGGVWRCDNFNSEFPVIYNYNQDYGVTQFYSAAILPESMPGAVVFGGTQDNGSNISNSGSGIAEFERITSADGGFCAANYTNANIFYTTKQYAGIFRFVNGVAEGYDTLTNPELTSSDVLFINPFEMDPNNPEMLYMGGKGLWRLKNASTAQASDWERATRVWGEISAIGISKSTPNLVYIGHSTGKMYKIVDADQSGSTYFPKNMDLSNTIPSSSYISCVFVNPADADHVLISLTNYGIKSIFESNDASSTSPSWHSVEGDLPDLPVRWIFMHPAKPQICYIATDVGVFYTSNLDGDNTQWKVTASGMGYPPVFMLRFRKSDYTLVAATHGRGIFTAKVDSTGANPELSWEERGPTNIGGRTRTIMIDPANEMTLWAGSVGGGLWKRNVNQAAGVFEKNPSNLINGKLLSHPNPFGKTGINLKLIATSVHNIFSANVFNLQGQQIAHLDFHANENELVYESEWIPGANISTGIYFVIIRAGERKLVKKLIYTNL